MIFHARGSLANPNGLAEKRPTGRGGDHAGDHPGDARLAGAAAGVSAELVGAAGAAGENRGRKPVGDHGIGGWMDGKGRG